MAPETLECQSAPSFDGEDDDHEEFAVDMELFCAGQEGRAEGAGPTDCDWHGRGFETEVDASAMEDLTRKIFGLMCP